MSESEAGFHRQLPLPGLQAGRRRRDGDLFRRAGERFAAFSGSQKAHRYVAASGEALNRNFCAMCGSRLYSSNLQSFPGHVLVLLGSMDRPDLIQPKLEMSPSVGWPG